MLQIHNVQVYNLTEALIASGNAMRTELIDVESLQKDFNTVIKEGTASDLTNTALMNEYDNGLKRCAKLTQAGLKGVSCHSNYLTGILVSFDVVYPCYWSPESQRYHWFNIVTSSSKMHRLCKMRGEEYFNKYTDKRSIAILQEKIDKYNSIEDNTWTVDSPKYIAFMEMLSSCPQGLELFEHVTTNYKQLQTIYAQRKNHRLLEDWGPFCKMIEELPYAKELIIGNKEEINI